MARGAQPEQGQRATPLRRTHLRLDTPDTLLVESPFVRSFILDQMAAGPHAKAVNVHFLPELGWELKPYQTTESNMRERTDAQDGRMKPTSGGGILSVGAGYVERPLFRKPTDLTGALTGADSGLVTQGEYFIERTVAASANWGDHALTADQAAFPSPPSTQNIKMDRVASGTMTLPKETSTVFRLDVPGNQKMNPDHLATYYFAGPAGYHTFRDLRQNAAGELARQGTGEYALELYGDGTCVVRERCRGPIESGEGALWDIGQGFRFAPSTQVAGRRHTIYIRNLVAPIGKQKIFFKCENTAQASSQNLGMFGVQAPQAPNTLAIFTYKVPATSERPVGSPPPSATPTAPRVDARRDHRVKFQVSVTRYPASGTLKCDPFSIPFWPTSSKPLRIIWLAQVPEGCSITVEAFNARDGVALTPNGVSGTYFKEFNITFGMDYFYVVFTLNSNTGHTKTPLLKGYRAQRNGRLVTSAPTEFDCVPSTPGVGGVGTTALAQRAFGPVNIIAAGGEPHQESGTTTVKDLSNGIDVLKTRGDIPFILETEYDSNPLNRSVLLEGYVRRPIRSKKGKKKPTATAPAKTRGWANTAYPSEEFHEIQLQLIGKWQRLSEQYSNQKWNWHWTDESDASGAPYKATDAIRTMFNWCGFDPATQIDVPDLPIRLWPTDNELDLFIEPGAPIVEFILKICKEYLNAAICWDPNAGAAGMLRLIMPTRPPYKRRVRLIEGPESGGDAGTYLAHNMNAFGTFDDDGTTLVNIPCYSRQRRTEPPEANCVLVTGVSLGDWSSYARLCQWAINIKSFNFHNSVSTADPNDPDYLGRCVPLFVIDPGLNTPRAVAWAARRYYDYTCHATITETVQTPLCLVTDPDDEEQRVPRKLRYYDAVSVAWDDDKTWLVRMPTVDYKSDFNQQQSLEIVKPVGIFAD